MPGPEQVHDLGPSPAQQRKEMSAGKTLPELKQQPVSPPVVPPPAEAGVGQEVDELTPAHLAEIAAKEGGFSGGPLDAVDGPVKPEDEDRLSAAGMRAVLEQVQNQLLRAEAERDAALEVVAELRGEES